MGGGCSASRYCLVSLIRVVCSFTAALSHLLQLLQLLIVDFVALEDGVPITDPAFYASEARCPDELVEHVFRPAAQSTEEIPLLRERIRILRQVGGILCSVRPTSR